MMRVSVTGVECGYNDGDPEGFRPGTVRLGPQLGAQRTGATVWELPPGEAACPYHYELGEEEWLLVLSGTPSVRTPDGVEQLAPDDVVFFPPGPDGAHQLRNDSDATARVLMWSNVGFPAAAVYPDSDKVGLFHNRPDMNALFRRTTQVDYFDGEVPRRD